MEQPSQDNDLGQIDEDICAMANTLGGTIVLGIGQRKDSNGNLIEFVINGWKSGKEDDVYKRAGDWISHIDPIPNIGRHVLPVNDSKFVYLLKVEPIISTRPYVIKGKGCYIRVGNSSIPAGREAILNLCRNTVDRVANVEALEVIATMLKTELVDLRTKALSYQTPPYLPPIEVDAFRDAAVSCRWLLVENDLMRENMGDGPSHREGYFSTIRHVRMLNSSIERYNFEEMGAGSRKEVFEGYHRHWTAQHDQWIMQFLDGVIAACKKFLQNC